jgi:hypothetical protein
MMATSVRAPYAVTSSVPAWERWKIVSSAKMASGVAAAINEWIQSGFQAVRKISMVGDLAKPNRYQFGYFARDQIFRTIL